MRVKRKGKRDSLVLDFDLGDTVEAAGVLGKVSHMSLVTTSILTFDNQALIVPNGKVWGNVIRNLTAEQTRRVDLLFRIGHLEDIEKAERILREIVESHELVLNDPEPMIRIHELGEWSIDFIVRPWAKTEDYWSVYHGVTQGKTEKGIGCFSTTTEDGGFRRMFLGTRLPLLTGHFAEVWMSQLMVNPEAKQVLSDVHQLAELSARLVEVTDSLPRQIADEQTVIIDRVMADVTELSQGTVEDVMGKVAVERSQAIDQFMSRLAAERTQTLRELGAEQQELNEIVGNLNVALKEGNSLVTALDQLAVKLRLDQPADPDAAPFNIRDYRDTLAEASQAARELTGLVESTDRSVASGNVQQLLPQLEVVLDRAESESEELVSHVFRLGILLILIWMVGYVASRLIYNYLAGRLWRETPNK